MAILAIRAAALGAALISAGAAHAVCTAQSPANRVALLELYTSEGCSSCPPADQYLAGLARSSQMVPLSLHVDYWNYIGWKDPFSRPVFSARQRWLAGLANSRTVYTPALFVGGREQRGGPDGSWLGRSWRNTVPDAVARINAQPALAEIRILQGKPGQEGVPVEVQVSARRPASVYLALTQEQAASQVNAGENRGRLLRHAHVVREWLGPQALAAGSLTVRHSVPLPAGVSTAGLGIVAFVQDAQGEVLQALATPLCEG